MIRLTFDQAKLLLRSKQLTDEQRDLLDGYLDHQISEMARFAKINLDLRLDYDNYIKKTQSLIEELKK